MILSKRSHTIQPQPMFRIMEQAQELERQGRKIIHLEIGDTTGFVNERLRELVVEEAAKSRFGYSPSAGEMDLREAVAEMYSKAKGVTFTHENVAIGPANALITQVLAAVTEPGDGIYIPDPGFPTYRLAAAFLGLSVDHVYVPGRGAPWWVDQIGDRRAIIINSPANPQSICLDGNIINSITEGAEKRGIPCVVDDAYRALRYTDSVLPTHRDNCIYLWSLSKEGAAPGLRIGAVIGPKEVAAKVADFTSLFHSCSPGFIQLAAARYLREDYGRAMVWEMPTLRCAMPDRIKQACEIISESPGLAFEKPDGGLYLFVNISQTGKHAKHFASQLLQKCGVAVCPGSAFGPLGWAHIRISLCVPESDLIEGCRRIVEFADGLERRAA